jgi:hypothetical protein
VPAKPGAATSDDRERLAIQHEARAEDARVAAKTRLPERVAQDRGADRGPIVLRLQHAAE